MSSVAGADALIIDVRDNSGGDPYTVAFIENRLLHQAPLHTLDVMRRDESIDKSFSTLTLEEHPTGSKQYGGMKSIILLTSKDTSHAAESFAYGLKHFQRAYIIEQDNFVTHSSADLITQTWFDAEDVFGEGCWFVGIPFLKLVHAITGLIWEGLRVDSNKVARRSKWIGEHDVKEVARILAVEAL